MRELGDWCTIVEGDVTDPESILEAVAGIDTVVHAAAMVSYQSGDEDRMMHVNAEGTANVVNMMLEAGARRLVYLSSVAALDRSQAGKVISPADRWPQEEPTTAYARSKAAAEREAWRGQAEGLSVAALYPSIVLGAGDWNGANTPALWKMAEKERGFYPRGTAGFVDVRDVTRAVLTVLDRNIDRDRFLLNAANLSWESLLTKIAQSIDARPPTYGMPAWQSALLWPLEGLRAKLNNSQPLITRDAHYNVQASYRYDGSQYTEVSGTPYLPIDATIEEIGKSYQMSRALGQPLKPTYLPIL